MPFRQGILDCERERDLRPRTPPTLSTQINQSHHEEERLRMQNFRPYVRVRSRRFRRVVLALATIGAVAPLSFAASAQAYTYDYSLYMNHYGDWNTRVVAHNYSYISTNSGGSTFPRMCVRLTRTTNGLVYGGEYCGGTSIGHHYAGDTGTYSWGSQTSFVDSSFPYHEEW
jgi:hypothetical protein